MTEKNHRAKDAVALLENDHKILRDLLGQLDETTSRGASKRTRLLGQIADEVRVHARIEEEIFYPAYRAAAKSKEDEKLFFEATEEHGLVDVVLPALEAEDPAGDVFAAKAKVLKDLIEHHAEEEETEMFPRAKKLLGPERLADLGQELESRKSQLKRDPKLMKKPPGGTSEEEDRGRKPLTFGPSGPSVDQPQPIAGERS